MPDQLAQHLSWDAVKYGLGVIGGFGLLAMTWCRATMSSNRQEIDLLKANCPTRIEVDLDMTACHDRLVHRMEKIESSLSGHIDRSADSVKELLYVVHPECKPDDKG